MSNIPRTTPNRVIDTLRVAAGHLRTADMADQDPEISLKAHLEIALACVLRAIEELKAGPPRRAVKRNRRA
jgi:hypothetical protein